MTHSSVLAAAAFIGGAALLLVTGIALIGGAALFLSEGIAQVKASEKSAISVTQSHPHVGMWVTDDGRIRHELLANGPAHGNPARRIHRRYRSH